jgi:hypothetical protein
LQANFASVSLPFFGFNQFDRVGLPCLTKYLRIDRTLVSTLPSSPSFGESWYNTYVGWWEESKWSGAETKSHPFFNPPYNWVPSVIHVLSPTTRHIIFSQSYTDDYGFIKSVVVTLLETATVPWTALELRERMYYDLQYNVPWDNPFYYDPPHYFAASFWYNDSGVFELNPFSSPNPVQYGFKCPYSLVVGADLIGETEWPGTGTLTAMRRPYATRIQKRASNRVYSIFENPVPLLNCGNINTYTTAVGDSYVVAKNTVIMPPSIAEMQSWGVAPGIWGFSSTLTC